MAKDPNKTAVLRAIRKAARDDLAAMTSADEIDLQRAILEQLAEEPSYARARMTANRCSSAVNVRTVVETLPP